MTAARRAYLLLAAVILVAAILLVLLVRNAAGDRPDSARAQAASPAGYRRPKLDYSKPLYTRQNAAVCPYEAQYQTRAGHGLDAATSAAVATSDRLQQLARIGCEVWPAGKRIYVADSEKGYIWQEMSAEERGSVNLLIFAVGITNDPQDGAAASGTQAR